MSAKSFIHKDLQSEGLLAKREKSGQKKFGLTTIFALS
jgi:hypothetical protein